MTTDTQIIDAEAQEVSKLPAYRLGMLLDQFDSFADKIDEARRTGRKIGPGTGFYQLDRELCGALLPGLHVVQGDTGTGKTAFCLQVACQCGFPALYVSCEMSAMELLRRTTARITETPLHTLKDPVCCLPAAQMKSKAREAAAAAPNLVIADSTLVFWNAQSILNYARTLKETTDSEHILIVVDSIHSWAAALPAEEYDRLGMAISALRKVAAELDCPVLYISEQSKAANRAAAKGQDMGSSASAGNRSIEYGAETIVTLKFAETDKESGRPVWNAHGETPVSAAFDKNRNSGGGKVFKLKFDGALQRFTEVPQ